MKAELFIQQEAIRFEIYKLLAECYYPPDETLSGKIKDLGEKLRQVSNQSTNWDGKKIMRTDPIQELKVDYAQLFVGPYTLAAPPYGSVYMEQERRIMGNSTMDVIKRYRQSGLVVAEDFKDAPDHITAELEFMHYLIYKEIEASNQGDANSTFSCLVDQHSFLKFHLGAWVSEFTRNVIDNANTTFYQDLARVTDSFIKDDYQSISNVLASETSNAGEFVEIESFPGQC